jgi:hypothetical protein
VEDREGDAAVVHQNACTPEDLKLCPADGPGNNEYLALPPVCTILSTIKGHGDFEALELKRLNVVSQRNKRLALSTMSKRMALDMHTAGSGEGVSGSGMADSQKKSQKNVFTTAGQGIAGKARTESCDPSGPSARRDFD